MVKRKIKEAKDWVKKYLIADSVEIKFLVLIIKGIKDKRLSSSPIHIPNHEEEEMEINVPNIKVHKKINLEI